jgi:hypothetical protein
MSRELMQGFAAGGGTLFRQGLPQRREEERLTFESSVR